MPAGKYEFAALSSAIWLVLARTREWLTISEIYERLPDEFDEVSPNVFHNLVWAMANRRGLLECRQRSKTVLEYAVTKDCCIPHNTRFAEVLELAWTT